LIVNELKAIAIENAFLAVLNQFTTGFTEPEKFRGFVSSTTFVPPFVIEPSGARPK